MSTGLNILLVEDNPGDVLLVKKGLATVVPGHTLAVATDGTGALAYFETHPSPDLVLLDLNLPRVDGQEVLVEMVSRGSLGSTVVVVLSSSASSRDALSSYEHHASLFMTKPGTYRELVSLLEEVIQFTRFKRGLK